MTTDEVAAVKMAVKRAKKAGVEAGFRSLLKWYDRHPNRDINIVLKCYKKAIKKGICIKSYLTHEQKADLPKKKHKEIEYER